MLASPKLSSHQSLLFSFSSSYLVLSSLTFLSMFFIFLCIYRSLLLPLYLLSLVPLFAFCYLQLGHGTLFRLLEVRVGRSFSSYFKYLKYEFPARDSSSFYDSTSSTFVLFGLRVGCISSVGSLVVPLLTPALFWIDALIFYLMFYKFSSVFLL